MSKAKVKRTASTKKRTVTPRPTRVMVLYGFDEQNRPRAALFGEANFELARKAAKALGLQVHVDDAKKLKPTLDGIKPGRIYQSGTGVVPNVSPSRFEKLLADLELNEPAKPVKLPDLKVPTSWDATAIGDTVLAQADSAKDGWWRATVEDVTADMLLLRSRDFPEITVRRHRNAVALLHVIEYIAPVLQSEAIAPGLPRDWSSLQPQHLVLAEEGPGEGHYEAIIEAVAGQELTLRWRDYKQPSFKRRKEAIALLNPLARK
ncbi:MAG TPA: hypothetical protein VGU01_01195 [Sphingomicrobium sp.]|nr:hypothetical protein [Sphingomicrobium sp.]